MKLSLPVLLTAGIGALLLWAGITDRDPLAVMHAILTSRPIPDKGSNGSVAGKVNEGLQKLLPQLQHPAPAQPPTQRLSPKTTSI
jgi:hypothetical protein